MMKSIKQGLLKKYQSVSLERKAIDLFRKYQDFTMIPKNQYIANLRIVFNHRFVPGDIVECGVWKGGMIAGIAELIGTKKAFLFDSYEGLPDAKEIDGETAIAWQKNLKGPYYFDNCSADERYALEAMSLSGCNFESIKGWFDVTLAQASQIEKISILRLDADWYDSTYICLKELFPKVSKGGVIIIDDYFTWDGCSRAVHDYLSSISSLSKINCTDSVGFIKKLD
ncbi:MAG: class I SAM-dependent methyltransferase [Cytophagia bacterium]|nr:class I SAM-dependent methyltransferase [Cytophagia bacterium]